MKGYIGRFAPTPSGPLHAGSLTAAVVSWLDARSRDGVWHVRIDDIDRPREVAGAADEILRTLEAYGLGWDGPVVRQSQRTQAYADALASLLQEDRVFPCTCSRQEVAAAGIPGWEGPVYPGTCRTGAAPGRSARALRLRIVQRRWVIHDRALGSVCFDLQLLGGDFVVRRADGLFAYQLATVVDDAAIGVTDVVRGIDLLGSVPRQLHLYESLGHPPPGYLHHPVVLATDGNKLSKSTGAPPVQAHGKESLLPRILRAIGIPGIDKDLSVSSWADCSGLLGHALRLWHPGRLPVDAIPVARVSPRGGDNPA